VSNPDLRPTRVLELLATLQKTAADFAGREEALARDMAARRHTINRQHRDGVDKAEARFTALVEESNALCQNGRQHLTALYEGRRMRVNRSGTAALRKLPLRARQARERWMGDLQLKQFQSEKKLEADKKAADKIHGDSTEQLDAAQDAMKKMRQKARRVFGGYFSFLRQLRPSADTAPVPASCEEGLKELQNSVAVAQQYLGEYVKRPLPKLFGYAHPVLVIPTLLVLAGGLAVVFPPNGIVVAGGLMVLLLLFVVGVVLGHQQGKPFVPGFGNALRVAKVQHAAIKALADHQQQEAHARAQEEYETTREAIAEQWGRSDQVEVEFEQNMREKIESQMPRITAQIDQFSAPKLARLITERDARQAHYRQEADARKETINATYDKETTALNQEEASRWDALAAEWKSAITPLYDTLRAIQAASAEYFPTWSESFLASWSTPEALRSSTRLGQLDTVLASHPQDPRLPLPGPAELTAPLALTYPGEGSLLFDTHESSTPEVIGTLKP